MASRIREKVERLFEVFVEIAKPHGKDEAPFIIQKYPPDFDDKEALMMIPKFVYPCPTDASKVDHFTFVLTDLDSMFRFGYCRHTTGHRTCLCIVSWLPWFEIFYKMLDLLAEITNRSEKNNVTNFLRATYSHEVPLPRISVTIVANEDMFNFTAPDPNVLPGIPSSRNLTEYYSAVDPYNMMVIFASMLHERRIYMTSKKLSRLTACIHAAEALLYPMHWQHLYIPVLPSHLIDYVSAPMPYLIGVHSNLVEKLKLNRVDVGDAVVVDLDANSVITEYDDLRDLPEDVSSCLKRSLKIDIVKNSMRTGDAISMAFLHALVRLIGGYRDALKFRRGEPITFDPEAFVHSRHSQSTQVFLEGMLGLQIFQQFIYGRLEILNSGAGFRDIFEQQAILYADKLNSQSKYKEWLKSVKKSGKKGWNGLRIKMKEQGKRAMADFKTKFSGLTDNEDRRGSNHQLPTAVAHTKPSKTKKVVTHAEYTRPVRPPRPPPPTKTTQLNYEKRVKPSAHVQDATDDSHVHLNYQRVDMNLMTDGDIQAAMLRSTSDEMIQSQNSSLQNSSDSETTDSEEEEPDISFNILQNSDEGLNSTPSSDESLHNQHRYAEVSGTDHTTDGNLILNNAVDHRSINSVARSRLKLTSHHNSTAENETLSSTLPKSYKKSEKSWTSSRTATLQEAPLINFDSSESEPTDSENFDPFTKSPDKSPQQDIMPSSIENVEYGSEVDLRNLQRNVTSRVSLTRSKAFRREQPTVPLRTHYLDDNDDLDGPKNDLPRDIFDPLTDLNSLSNNIQTSKDPSPGDTAHSVVNDPLSSHSPRRDGSNLLTHEWSLASLAKGPSIRLPATESPLSPRYQMNLSTLDASQKIPSARQSLPVSTSSAISSRGAMHNHMHTESNEMLNQNLSSNKRVSDFPRTDPGTQHLQSSKLLNKTPNHISAVNYPSLSSRQSSILPRAPGTMNFVSPTPSTSAPIIHGGGNHVERSGGVDSSFSSSSSGASVQRQSGFLSDLQDIDFGCSTSLDQSIEQQNISNNKVSTSRISQSDGDTKVSPTKHSWQDKVLPSRHSQSDVDNKISPSGDLQLDVDNKASLPRASQPDVDSKVSRARYSRTSVDSKVSPSRPSRPDVDSKVLSSRYSRRSVDSDILPSRPSQSDVNSKVSPSRPSRPDVDSKVLPSRYSRTHVDNKVLPSRPSRPDVDSKILPSRYSRTSVDSEISLSRPSQPDVDNKVSPSRPSRPDVYSKVLPSRNSQLDIYNKVSSRYTWTGVDSRLSPSRPSRPNVDSGVLPLRRSKLDVDSKIPPTRPSHLDVDSKIPPTRPSHLDVDSKIPPTRPSHLDVDSRMPPTRPLQPPPSRHSQEWEKFN